MAGLNQIMQNAIEIDSLRSIDNYPVVCITGGEPGIMENKVLETIAELRANNPDVKIYMYSAWYKNRWGHRLLDHLDGVLFIDRLSPNERKRIEKELVELEQQYSSLASS